MIQLDLMFGLLAVDTKKRKEPYKFNQILSFHFNTRLTDRLIYEDLRECDGTAGKQVFIHQLVLAPNWQRSKFKLTNKTKHNSKNLS